MKSLPIKKGIEELLQKERSGIWEIKDKYQYLKATSKLYHHPIRLPVSQYGVKNAVSDAVRCAKVYKKLIEIGMYHPKTEIVIFKDDEGYLSLMVTMPKLKEIKGDTSSKCYNKARYFKAKLSLKENDWWDLDHLFNWGVDKKGDVYAHDLHVCNLLNGTETYSQILKLVEQMGIK